MKAITQYVCEYDGTKHHSERDLRKYLDKLYADLIMQLSHGVIQSQVGTKALMGVSSYIDDNLPLFVRMNQIRLELAEGLDND